MIPEVPEPIMISADARSPMTVVLRAVRAIRVFHSGQSIVEFALLLPIILVLVLGAVDFGRVMQARVTADSAAKAGASWGASHLQNATAALPPAYGLSTNPKNCGAGLTYPPNCNILERACAEAAGLPGFSGGTVYTGDGGDQYQVCAQGSPASVCSASATQSNPYLVVAWKHNGTSFTPSNAGQRPVVGDEVTVTGTYCFKTFFPGPASTIKWDSPATYSVQP